MGFLRVYVPVPSFKSVQLFRFVLQDLMRPTCTGIDICLVWEFVALLKTVKAMCQPKSRLSVVLITLLYAALYLFQEMKLLIRNLTSLQFVFSLFLAMPTTSCKQTVTLLIDDIM